MTITANAVVALHVEGYDDPLNLPLGERAGSPVRYTNIEKLLGVEVPTRFLELYTRFELELPDSPSPADVEAAATQKLVDTLGAGWSATVVADNHEPGPEGWKPRQGSGGYLLETSNNNVPVSYLKAPYDMTDSGKAKVIPMIAIWW